MINVHLDCEDESLWIDDKLRLAQSEDVGNSLVEVNMLQRKNDTLQKEVEKHDARIQQVCQDGHSMIAEDNPKSEEFQRSINNLLEKFDELRFEIEARRRRLEDSQKVQQYLFDCCEAEAWMGEQELYMMSDAGLSAAPLPEGVVSPSQPTSTSSTTENRDNTGRLRTDEQNAQSQLKKHLQLESEVEDHAVQIRQLGDVSRQLISNAFTMVNQDGSEALILPSGHTTESLTKRQMQIDKLYAGLKDLAQERRQRLEETVRLCVLQRDIQDLEAWIADKVVVADSNELGQDFEHVNLLKERFSQFAADTQQIGQERVIHVSQVANHLIDAGHADSAEIARWNENLNEAWENLLELLRTRALYIQSSWDLQKYFADCKEVLSHIDEKKKCIPEEFGRDAQSVAQLTRRHNTFEENDLKTLGDKIFQVRSEAKKLFDLYAGDKAKEISDKEQEVINEWNRLLNLINIRKHQLADMSDLYKFFNMSRDLMMWMETQMLQMRNEDKPRDVSGVELLINNHQSLKAEIDARAENFTICLNLGKDLINRRIIRANEVKDKCVQLCMQRDRITDQWRDRWDHLQLILEVYQFARDAAVAEQWLIAQEPYLLNDDLGETLDQVEQLIKKHETFEKSIHAQEERFNALRRLTTLEIKHQRTLNNNLTNENVDSSILSDASSVVNSTVRSNATDIENSRLAIYLEEFKTLEERERDAETVRMHERELREAEDRLRADQERQRNDILRERADVIIDITNAMASAGQNAATSPASSSSRLHSSPVQSKQGKLLNFTFSIQCRQ